MKKIYVFFVFFLLCQFQMVIAQKWELITSQYATADAFVAGFNVADDGATGDGTTDVTAIFQTRLNELGQSGGGVLFVPEGKYVIKGNLNIPKGVTLRGEWEKPEKGKPVKGTVLMAYSGKGNNASASLITMEPTTGVMDLNIWYPEQHPDNIVPYPPSITFGKTSYWGNDYCTAKNITLVNSYEGIILSRSNDGGCPNMYNIYGTPLNTGIEIDKISDVGRIEWIDFSPDYWSGSGLPDSPQKGSAFEDWIYNNGKGILMMKNDWSYTCFVSVEGYNTGFLASGSSNSGAIGPNGHNYGMTFRNCKNAVSLTGIANSGIMFTNITAENCENGFVLAPNVASVLHINNCDLNVQKAAVISDEAATTRILLHQTRIQNGTVTILGGVLSSSDSDYDNAAPQIIIGNNAAADITGNRFKDPVQIQSNSMFECIVDHAPLSFEKLPDVPRIHPEEQKQRPDRPAFYLATAAPFNAKGDATTDNTEAIQKALDQAALEGGGIVYLPPGKYKVLGNLTVPSGVELKGSLDVRSAPTTPGTTLEVYAGRGDATADPFLKLSPRSGLRGIVFNYPEQNSGDLPDIPEYPYCIQATGSDVYVVNVGLRAVYKGLDLFTYPCDNHYVDYLAGHAFREGIKIGGNSRNGKVCNLQFNVIVYACGYQSKFGSWPNSIEAGNPKAYSYSSGYLDFMIVDDCENQLLYNNFGYGSQRGTVFTSKTGKGASGIALGHAIDGARRALSLESLDMDGFDFINSQLVALKEADGDNSRFIETASSFAGRASIFSCNYWGNAQEAVVMENGNLNLYLSNFTNPGQRDFTSLTSGAKLNLVNSVIRPINPLLKGDITGLSVQSSITEANGIVTTNCALWKNNLPFNVKVSTVNSLNRTGWIASASVNNAGAQSAIDGNATTRWTAGAQKDNNGAWFSVDMRKKITFSKIVLDHSLSANDFPEEYKVYVSNDGRNWGNAIVTLKGSNSTTICSLPEQTAQYVKIELCSTTKTNYWSIHEFYVFRQTDGGNTAIPFSFGNKNEEPAVYVSGNHLYLKGSLQGDSQICIYNISGQLAAAPAVVQSSMEINLQPGIYIVLVKNGEQIYLNKIKK
jgi:hypothetical protein